MYYCNKCIHFTGVEDCSCDIPEERVWWKKSNCKNFELKDPVTVGDLRKKLSKYASNTLVINAEKDICTDIVLLDNKLQIC